MAAICRDRLLTELAQQYDVHANKIKDWRKSLMAEAGSLFDSGASQGPSDSEEEVAELHARIGELPMERDFLSKALGRGR